MEVTIDGVRFVPVTHDEVALSVLVPSVSTRRKTFAPKIADSLFGQHEALSPAERQRVEILIVTDTGRDGGMLVGDKRNALVRMARGKYVVFVDDDDRVADDYLKALLFAADFDRDCITFDASVSINGGPRKTCRYSQRFTKDSNHATHYERLPNHITAIRRVLALACPFPSKQCGEDADFAVRLRPTLNNEYRIERELYFYDADERTTETQGNRGQRLALVAAPSPTGTLDVVILSKATTPELKAMCQKAVDSLRAGSRRHLVNVTVVEQVEGVDYFNVNHIDRQPGEFNYNRFANNALRRGTAPWVMVANSDLVFEDGWLDALLESGHDCVSPVDPSHKSQRNVRNDEAGWQNGHHFSGWCFMLTRKLWERIGGFDDCVRYWCSDNVVIEQCRAVDVMPRLVAKARVRHLGSQTAPKPPDDDTWAQVRIFNQKYPQRPLFRNDNRFITYCRKNGLAA